MSYGALRLNPDGSTTAVKSSEINDENKTDDYICDKPPCCAKMVPRALHSKRTKTHFVSPFGGHIPGCDNDKSPKVVYRYYLRKWRKEFSSLNFFVRFGKRTDSPPEKYPSSGNKERRKSPSPTAEEKKKSRSGRRKARDPKYPEYFNTLSGAPIDEALADGTVRDYIIDHRTIDYHRMHDLTPARAVIALCHKVPRDHPVYQSVNRRRDQILLMDAFASADNAPPIYFLVTTGNGLGYEIISAVLDGKTVALIAPWRKVADNLYASAAPVTPGHVLYLDSPLNTAPSV